ncbi:MAG: hypothetical protein ACI4LO_01925 [Anaerovoracaceae bacterium]
MVEVTSLFYPEQKIQIGKYIFDKGVSLEVFSTSDSYYDWAKIRLQEELLDKAEISEGDIVNIQLGYDENLQEVFQGYVYKDSDNSSGEKEFLLKDDMLLLEKLKIRETFLDVVPEEIVKYCLQKAGITKYEIFDGGYPAKKVVPIVQKNGIQVLEEVKRLWGMNNNFYCSKGIFYFGKAHKQEKIYTFEYGNNIISLLKENAAWVLESASVPFIRHSDVINLVHPNLTGQFKVSKVCFTSRTGFIRTRLYLE